MGLSKIVAKIIQLKEEDDKLRDQLSKKGILFERYHPEMEALHNRNAKELDQIIDGIGFPTSDVVGKEASHAAWLIIQHAIGQPDFMRRSARLLENAVEENREDPVKLAYLTDRIAVFEDRPQLYGTQFDWDENGELYAQPFDDVKKVNQRRKALGLNSLEEQTGVMQQQVKNENQAPPRNFEERKQAFDSWRISVGWLK